MASPKYVHVLIPRTCDVTLFGKRVFTDVIKNIDMRRLLWISQVCLKCHSKYSPKREAEVD